MLSKNSISSTTLFGCHYKVAAAVYKPLQLFEKWFIKHAIAIN